MSAGAKASIIDSIAEQLRQRLAAMSPGERLPTVRGLMASLGVSQFTVQRALGRLKEEGLIDSQVGRGTFVAGQKPTPTRLRNVLVLSSEQQSDRADELTRLLHQAFLKREWRSVILAYADFDQAAEIVEGLPRFDACVVQPRGRMVPLSLWAVLKARCKVVVVEGYGVSGIDVDAVAIDWPSAVSLALRQLYDLGHRRIGFVAQSLSLRAFADTTAEFRRLHAWAGLSAVPDPVIPLAWESEESAFTVLERHLVESRARGRPGFSAYIVYPRAYHGDRLIRAFTQAGLSIPEQASVVVLGYADFVHEHVGRLDSAGHAGNDVVNAVIATIEARWRDPREAFRVRHLAPELIGRGSSAALAPP